MCERANACVGVDLCCLCADVVERILEELWDDTTTTTYSPVHPNEVVELTPFWHQLLHHATNFGNLAEFVNAQQWHSGDQTEMISGIILVFPPLV